MIRRVTIRFSPFGRRGRVQVVGASGKEVSFEKILGMKLRMLGVKRNKDDLKEGIEIFLELEK